VDRQRTYAIQVAVREEASAASNDRPKSVPSSFWSFIDRHDALLSIGGVRCTGVFLRNVLRHLEYRAN